MNREWMIHPIGTLPEGVSYTYRGFTSFGHASDAAFKLSAVHNVNVIVCEVIGEYCRNSVWKHVGESK